MRRAVRLILDTAGNGTVGEYQQGLRPQGRAAVTGFEEPGQVFRLIVQGGWASGTSSQKIGLMLANTNHQDLAFIREVMEPGLLMRVIDLCCPFGGIPETLLYLGTKTAQGKIVITIGEYSTSKATRAGREE